ncbi:beta-lactamase family protein, partial [candidate division WWE3 bacterium]|nr:beta-lactamase family protein [candidate division WWE3 bacterium]
MIITGDKEELNPTLTTEITFGQEVDPSKVGMSTQGVKAIVDVFYSQVSEGLHFGAQLVVLKNGKVVVDRVAGLANVRTKLQVSHDTLFHGFSITKPFTAMCIHKLVEQGKLELDTPIAKYWPEFGSKGKEAATIRHVFLHQAGVPSRGLYTQIPLWLNWKYVTRNVANLEAEYPPGSKTSYHIVNYGFILGEIVRRVSGKPIQVYLKEEFLDPLNLRDTYLGLPRRKLKEASRIYSGDSAQSPMVFLFNLPCIRGAVLPAATLNSTARDIAIFFQM